MARDGGAIQHERRRQVQALFGKYQTTASSMAPYSIAEKRLNTAAAGARKVAAEATTPHSTR